MSRKMYMIGNAHLDPVWLWDWKEGYAENNATMLSMIDRLEEFDFVKFTSSSSVYYEWLEESSPEMFEKVKALVAEGRWELCGGWYVQPDCNIPSGESFARHALYAQNYFHDKFGCISDIGYCVDSFGHSGTLPQILRLSRMDKYVFMRPGRHEKDIEENLFIWESADGSQVTTYRIPFNYNAYHGIDTQIDDCMNEFIGDFPGVMAFYGVGNHGGGPTIENIKRILERKKDYPDVDIEFSTPSEFFADVKKSGVHLPVVRGDLQHHASGCYSALSAVKSMNRRAENALVRAEKLSVVSEKIRSVPYDSSAFDRAWKNILFNQFHDILAGTCIRTAYTDAYDMYGESISIASRLENKAFQSLSWNIDIPRREKSIPIVVFNPHSWDIETDIEIEGGHHKNMEFPENPRLIDYESNEIPFQKIMAHVHCRNRERILFRAGIPALGYRLFYLDVGTPATSDAAEGTRDDSLILDNKIVRCSFSPDTGNICSLFDYRKGIEILDEPSSMTICKDTSDTWGHATVVYHDVIDKMKLVRIEKLEAGPVRQKIRTVHEFSNSTVIQDYSLSCGDDSVAVETKIVWNEHLACLRFEFPVVGRNHEVTYSAPFGYVEKACNGEEEPMQNWFDIHDEQGVGLAIVNTGKYSGACYGNTISQLVLRSPVYSHHIPAVLDMPDDMYDFIDQEVQYFEYRIVPHGEAISRTYLEKTGLEMNQKPISLIETYHDGVLPGSDSYMNIHGHDVLMTSFKKASIGEGYVVRLEEYENQAGTASVAIFGSTAFSLDFKPLEIKTIRVDLDGNFVEELDFLEWSKES